MTTVQPAPTPDALQVAESVASVNDGYVHTLGCRYYSHLEWEEKSRRDEEYLRNCAEYPIGKETISAEYFLEEYLRNCAEYPIGKETIF